MVQPSNPVAADGDASQLVPALRMAARLVAVVGALVVAFALVPIHTGPAAQHAVVWAGLTALVLFVVAFARQVRRILDSPYPLLTGVEALVVVLTVFLLGFALVHVSLAASDPSSYSEPMDKVDAVYFTVTVLSTVGFGDITPVTSAARVVVTVQMLADLALLAVTLRVIFGIARHADQRRRSTSARPDRATRHDES